MVNTTTRTPRIRNLIGFSALIMLLFCVYVIYQGVQTYKYAINEGEQNAARLANILSDQVEITFLGVDLSLRRAIERQYFNSLFGNNLPAYTEQNFKVWLNETPQIIALALIDQSGKVTVAAHKTGYENWLDYDETLIGQRLFEHMREAADNHVFIGKHYTQDNPSLILMSRRYNNLNGEFGGIVLAAVDPQYFIDFYESVAFGEQKYMSLSLEDGTTLAGGPYDSAFDQTLIRQKIENTQLQPSAMNIDIMRTEYGFRIMSLRHLTNMPVVVSTVLNESDVLLEWHEERTRDMGFLLLFTAFGSILSFLVVAMAKQIMRAEKSESSAILASQAKSEFLATMSHELRTPLNAIIGFSEMINSGYFGPLNAKQKERVHDINLCGSHLLQLITDILEFSKGDAGKLELVEERVNMEDIVNEGVRILSGKIKTKSLHLMVHVEPHMPNLWGDKRKIRQVLINLMSNAIKFTPENGTLTIVARLDQQQNMNLIVSDTGIGIAEADIVKALSVFGQVHRNKSHEGTGLGLPLCKMYAELHDGDLQLTSKVGEGTTVKVIFPHQRVLPNKS